MTAMNLSGHITSIEIEQVDLDKIDSELLRELEEVYSSPFHNSHMYESLIEDIERNPEIFQLFIARSKNESKNILGSRIIQSIEYPFIEYFGFDTIHGNRFSVLPKSRRLGIGQQIITRGKDYVFNNLGKDVIFGYSAEIAALSMYGRNNALYKLKTIEEYSDRNSASENIQFFKELLSNSAFRTFRLPVGNVHYVYCKDEKVEKFFLDKGYISREELLGS